MTEPKRTARQRPVTKPVTQNTDASPTKKRAQVAATAGQTPSADKGDDATDGSAAKKAPAKAKAVKRTARSPKSGAPKADSAKSAKKAGDRDKPKAARSAAAKRRPARSGSASATKSRTASKPTKSGDGGKPPAARPRTGTSTPKQAKPAGAPKPVATAKASPSKTKPREEPSGPDTTAPARARRARRGLPDPGFASAYRHRLYQLHEWLWRGDGAGYERLPTHGVVGLDELTLPKTRLVEAYPDRPSPARLVDWTVDALPMRPERLTFIDLGSGRGRVLMEAAKHPFQEVIGVEVTRELHETALMNLRHWPRWRLACRNVTLVNGDVGQFDLPRRNIVLYLFRPFTERLMMAMARKATAVARAGHEVFVIVVDPKHAMPFNESPIFETITPPSSVRRRLRWQSPYAIAFFRANLP